MVSGLPITKVGINFDSATHNITDWVVECEMPSREKGKIMVL